MHDLIAKDTFDRLPERYRDRAREIARRVSEIDALLKPCTPNDIRDEVVRLRSQLRAQPDTDARELADAFKAACRDLPAWAIAEAANDFLAGRVDNHTGQYMPTCAEFAKRARHILTPFLAEHSSLRFEATKLIERAADEHRRHLIDMERSDPAVRERVAQLIEDANFVSAKPIRALHGRLNAEVAAKLDALRKPRKFVSKIDQTRIGRGQQ